MSGVISSCIPLYIYQLQGLKLIQLPVVPKTRPLPLPTMEKRTGQTFRITLYKYRCRPEMYPAANIIRLVHLCMAYLEIL